MAKTKGPRKVRRYDNEFKVKAVKLSQLPGVQVKDVAASFDIQGHGGGAVSFSINFEIG